MYRLEFLSDQKILLGGSSNERVQGIYHVRSKKGNLNAIIRQGQKLLGYKYSSEHWLHQWNETIFNKAGQYPLNLYPWFVNNKIVTNENVVILKHPDGIRFYRLNDAKSKLDYLTEDGNFHEVYDFDFLWGNFYPNPEWFGIMARNKKNNINFFVTTKDSFKTDRRNAVFVLNTKLIFSSNWKAPEAEFFTTDLRKQGIDAIGLRSFDGLEFYEFNSDYLLQRIVKTSQIPKPKTQINDKLFFVNISHHQYQEILHFNESGLFTYQYDDNTNNYQFINCDTKFTHFYGWSSKFLDSIQTLDVDSDGFDDLIFTDADGIKAISFDGRWNEILTSEELPSLQRYATVIGTLQSSSVARYPSIFIQDEDGNVQWGKIIKNYTKITTVKSPTTITTTTPTSPTQKLENNTPEQNSRIILSEKPILRWADQWNHNYLKEAVDIESGQVQFALPMIDILPSTGWGFQLSLSYQSQSQYADLLGVGWSMTLAEDFIFVDYRGSVYPNDAEYYLMMEGRPQQLKLVDSVAGIDSYKITEFSDDKISIKHHSSKERWIIEGEVEQTIYGKSDDPNSNDALRWSLSWKNWRGIGRNKSHLQPIITAWFLKKRIDKPNQRVLYYHYDVDEKDISGKAYTSAIRLKKLSDDKNFQLTFVYATKNSNEYETYDPIDDEGYISFPVQLTTSHYLQGYAIVTATYSQKFQFIYSIEGKNRLLKEIHQESSQGNESVLQFSYKNVLENPVIESCKLPQGITVTFNYKVITEEYPFNDAIIYPTTEQAKIGYGSNYTVMAYRELNPINGKIIVKLMNREMTQINLDCKYDEEKFPCPSAKSEIKDFYVETYKNSFIVFSMNDNNSELHVYNHRYGKWSRSNVKILFSKEALFRANDHIIAVSEKSQNEIRIFLHDDQKFEWIETKIDISKPFSRLALHDQTIVGYDDHQLMLFYQNTELKWNKHILKSNLNHFKSSLDYFDLELSKKQEYLTQLNYNGLQVINNMIMLSAIKEYDGKLSTIISLFLLNNQHEVIKTQLFTLHRENIRNVKYELKNEINWSLYTAQITQQGIVCGNDTILRITGTEWQRDLLKTNERILLGSNFILEPINDDKSVYKLYKQDGNKIKQGKSLQKLTLHYPGQLLNHFPIYIAYQMSESQVNVITFKDEKTLGFSHTFSDEYLTADSDYRNLITISNATATSMTHSEPKEYIIRSSSSLIPKQKFFVSKITFKTADEVRSTGYKRSYSRDNHAKTFSETVTIIPGANKNKHGWYEAIHSIHLKSGKTTALEKYFDASGKELLAPFQKTDKNKKEEKKEKNLSKLLDKSGNWLISDFSPYNLSDDALAYYGFESYERNSIGDSKLWKIHNAQVIERDFAFTGENYLQLNSSSFIEGVLEPHYQQNVYLAACWIRSSQQLVVNSTVPYFIAILSTENDKQFARIQAQVKHQLDDWFYLELPIDLQQINRESADDAKLRITLRIESFNQQTIDIDHIRFTPLRHDFQAFVYSALTGSQVAIIKSNGLVLRTIYNRLGRNIGNLQEDGQLKSLTSCSYTNRGNKIKFTPNTLTLEPESGFYETFNAFAMQNRWKVDNSESWKIAPGQMWHKNSNNHRVNADKYLFDKNAAALRFYFALQNSNASLSLNFNEFGSFHLTRQSDDSAELVLPNNSYVKELPSWGEIIIMIENTSVWLWFDGVLLVDNVFSSNSNSPWSSFAFEAQGHVLIEDCLIMNRASVRVEYKNAFGEKIQEIQLEDSQNVQVTETIYDELGREAINTKPIKINRNDNDSLLAYHSNFVINKTSIWQTGILQGDVEKFNQDDQGFAYKRTQYASNPLNQPIALGLPGKDFSIIGRYATKISHQPDIDFMKNLFPSNQGYRQQIQHMPNGSRSVIVYDKNQNKVALYEQVAGYNYILSTYEYDAENRLVKILPPLYHEKVETAMKLSPWQSGEDHLTSIERKWQKKLATRSIYDDNGRLIRKTTPDTGTIEFLYNQVGNKRFMVSLDESINVKQIIFFDYDFNGRMIQSGYLRQMLSIDKLKDLLEVETLPNAEVYQKITFSDDDHEPLLRGRIKKMVTKNPDYSISETLNFDANQRLILKSTTSASEDDKNNQLTEVKKDFVRDKVKTIKYPIKVDRKPLEIAHTYNQLGKLIKIKISSQNYVKFTYHATGQLASEEYQSEFIRKYRYNSPGFLQQISDPFLTENIAYTENGYGQQGFGDGMVMQTTFNASWVNNSDQRDFQLNDSDLNGDFSKSCIDALKRYAYLNAHGKPMKLFIKDIDNFLPLKCNKNDIAERIAEKKPPIYYGYRYAYGNHQELIKAKYFTDDTEKFIEPLQEDSFSKEIPNLSQENSKKIWRMLIKNGFILADRPRSDFMIGKAGKSFFQKDKLKIDLTSLQANYFQYVQPIMKLIISAIIERKSITQTDFETMFLNWNDLDRNSYILLSNYQLGQAQKIYEMLANKGYLSIESNPPLDEDFMSILSKYSNLIPDIIRVLTHRFAHALGKTAFDVESYDIDANGNHQHFYSGFKRYELRYLKDTNKIESIILGFQTIDQGDAQIHSVKHDLQGNVIQALHKGIENIEYHPVSQRTTQIKMTDGRILRFYYDAKGERSLKKVYNAQGEIIHETRYFRDEQDRVLVDQKTSYLTSPPQKILTAYIYGPRGLLGFYRNNSFYTVNTDHLGSTRLIIKDDQVVAAYDYLPYGKLMRSYGNNPQHHIAYRYTGQEIDEETGLYNYHARLYDPSIGRFYQIDPKSQYFSPYKYAGNSPLSLVDPDGQEAILVLTCLLFGIFGAYISAALVNNSDWNPVTWKWSNPNTLGGILGGGTAGVFIAVGLSKFLVFVGAKFTVATAGTAITKFSMLSTKGKIIGTIATTGLSISGSYSGAAKYHGSYNISKWNWNRAETYNEALQGIIPVVNLPSTLTQYSRSKRSLSESNYQAQLITKQRIKYMLSISMSLSISIVKSPKDQSTNDSTPHKILKNNLCAPQENRTNDRFDKNCLINQHFMTSSSSRPVSWISRTYKGFINILSSFSNSKLLNNDHDYLQPSVSIKIDKYSAGHFNGMLQLLDLFIRKKTSVKYQQYATFSDLDYAERCLNASEQAAKYIETIKNDPYAKICDEFEYYKAFLNGNSMKNMSQKQITYPNM